MSAKDQETDEVGEELAALLGPRGGNGPTQDEAAGLPEQLERAIAAEGGALPALRSRPTSQRTLLAVLLVLACVGAVLGLTRRPDLAMIPGSRMLADLALLGTPLVAALLVALRPLHRPPLPSWVQAALVLTGTVALVVVVWLPMPHADDVAGSDHVVRRALTCFAFGSAFAAIVVVGLRALSRGGGRLWMPTIAVAVASAIAGVTTLYLHCPITHPLHLWLGHATVLVPLLGVAFALGRRGSDG